MENGTVTIGHFKNINGERESIIAEWNPEAEKWSLVLGEVPFMYDINTFHEVRANVRLMFWHPCWEMTFDLQNLDGRP